MHGTGKRQIVIDYAQCGLDASIINTVTEKDFDMTNINGKQGFNDYLNDFSFINHWNETIHIEDELQRRIAQRQILLKRLNQEDILAQGVVHDALADVISDYDKIIQQLEEINKLKDTKTLNDQQIKFIDGLMASAAQMRARADQNYAKMQNNDEYLEKSKDFVYRKSRGWRTKNVDEQMTEQAVDSAKQEIKYLNDELDQLYSKMDEYGDFEDLSAYDKIELSKLEKEAAALQLELSEYEMIVSNNEKAQAKKREAEATTWRNSRDTAAATIKALQDEQAALNGLTPAQEKQARLDKIQAEAKQKKLKYTQQQLEAIDKERQKLKQLNEEKAKEQSYTKTLQGLKHQKNLLNFETDSYSYMLEKAEFEHSELDYYQQHKIADAMFELSQQMKRSNTVKSLEDRKFNLLMRYGELSDNSKNAQLARAIEQFERTAKYTLTRDERKEFKKLFEAEWAFNQQKPILELVNGIKTNALAARGGFAASITADKTRDINRQIAVNTKKQIDYLKNIEKAVKDSGVI